jgi:hypothetical protein
MIEAKTLLDRHEDLKSLRQPFETGWRDNARLFAPEDRDLFDGATTQNNNRHEDIYDATPIHAADDFASGLFGQMTNPSNRWFGVSSGDPDLDRWGPAQAWLWSVGTAIGASLGSTVTRFYSNAPGWFRDLGVYGFGTMYSEEVVGQARFRDLHVPVNEGFIDTNADGDVVGYHREMRVKGEKAKAKFPELAAMGSRVSDKADLRIIHCVRENPDVKPGVAGPRGMAWLSYYLSPDAKDFRRMGAYHEFPYHVLRWKTRAGRAYPSGPGDVARPDAAMLQEMERTHIVAAQFAAEPTLLATDMADIVASDIVPNGILYGGVTAAGRQALLPLNRAQNLQLSLEQSRERREAIRRAFFFSILSLINRPQMTATEVEKFDMERLRQMAPYVERIQSDGLTPLLARRFNILQRAGALPPPPPELEKRALTITHVSPLAKLQQLDEAKGVLNYVTGAAQIAQLTGDMSVMDNIDGDEAQSVLHAVSGAPPAVKRSQQGVERIRQARAGAQQQAVAIEQEAQQVETAAVAAHAMQASSTAKKRAA